MPGSRFAVTYCDICKIRCPNLRTMKKPSLHRYLQLHRLGPSKWLACRDTEILQEDGSVEFRVDGLDQRTTVDRTGAVEVNIDVDHALDFLSTETGRVPSPADLVAGVEVVESLNDGERWRLGLSEDEALFAGVRGYAELDTH